MIKYVSCNILSYLLHDKRIIFRGRLPPERNIITKIGKHGFDWAFNFLKRSRAQDVRSSVTIPDSDIHHILPAAGGIVGECIYSFSCSSLSADDTLKRFTFITCQVRMSLRITPLRWTMCDRCVPWLLGSQKERPWKTFVLFSVCIPGLLKHHGSNMPSVRCECVLAISPRGSWKMCRHSLASTFVLLGKYKSGEEAEITPCTGSVAKFEIYHCYPKILFTPLHMNSLHQFRSVMCRL